MLLAYDPADPAAFPARLERLVADPDPHVALPARQCLAPRARERRRPRGRHRGGRARARARPRGRRPVDAGAAPHQPRRPDHDPRRYRRRGRARARRPARDGAAGREGRRAPAALAARPLRRRRGAARGRGGRARSGSTPSTAATPSSAGSPSARSARAELALARGDVAAGLRLLPRVRRGARRDAVAGDRVDRPGAVGRVRRVAGARRPCALRDEDADVAYARGVFAHSRGRVARLLGEADPQLDYPVAGLALLALGAWGLLRDAEPAEDAVGLLVLAERFAYNRMIPTMAWERIAPLAEARAPGRIAVLPRGARRPARRPRCSTEARGLVERLPRLEVALVAAHRQRREDHHHDEAGEQRPADLGGDGRRRWPGRGWRRPGATPG